MMPPRIAAFLAAARAQEGLPYTWPCPANAYSGKGGANCTYPEGRDCSGLVSVSLWAAGDALDRRETWNADHYWRELPRTEQPEPGDLVLYGARGRDGRPDRAMHIEILMEDGRTFGAIQGDRDTIDPITARKAGACVKFRRIERHDLLGYVVNPLRLQP